jgi:hypothetical protein
MTPAALRDAIASARLRPRMYGDDPGDLESYLHGLVAGAYDGDADAPREAWAKHLDAPLRPGVYPDATADSVCDHALRVVAALWPQDDAAQLDALDLDAIEARAAAAQAGPWRSTWPDPNDPNNLDEPVVESLAPGLSYAERMVVGTMWHDGSHAVCGERNAAFIAAARADVPALVAALRASRAEVAALRADIAARDRVAAEVTAHFAGVADKPLPLGFDAALAAVRNGRFVPSPRCPQCDGVRRIDDDRGDTVPCPSCVPRGEGIVPAANPDRAQLAALAGEAFAEEFPYAFGALHGGVAHRSEVR